MTGKAGRSRRQRCVTCTPSEWRVIKARAREEGMDASTYILSRVLDGEAPDGPPDPEIGYPMALTGIEQREQFEVLQRWVSGCGPLMLAPFIPGRAGTMRQGFGFLMRSLDKNWKPAARQDPEPASETGAEKEPGPVPSTTGRAPEDRLRENPESGPEPGPVSETATTDSPGTVAARDERPRQADLFDRIEAGPPAPAARPRDFPDGIEIEPDWHPGPGWEGAP